MTNDEARMTKEGPKHETRGKSRPTRYSITLGRGTVMHDGDDNPASSSPNTVKRYDLEERTARFGERIIQFVSKLPRSPVLDPLVNQLVRAGTSPGSNYCEADDAVSKKEFCHKIATCKKEARETKYWLRMVVAAHPVARDQAKVLWQEAKELHLIFAAIHRRRDGKPKFSDKP